MVKLVEYVQYTATYRSYMRTTWVCILNILHSNIFTLRKLEYILFPDFHWSIRLQFANVTYNNINMSISVRLTKELMVIRSRRYIVEVSNNWSKQKEDHHILSSILIEIFLFSPLYLMILKQVRKRRQIQVVRKVCLCILEFWCKLEGLYLYLYETTHQQELHQLDLVSCSNLRTRCFPSGIFLHVAHWKVHHIPSLALTQALLQWLSWELQQFQS